MIAAKYEARRLGYSQLRIGFNWFYRTDPNSEDGFWSYLHDHGGAPFAASVDWAGLDVYPGTFFPPGTPPDRTGDFVVNALSQLHGCFLHEGGLSKSTPIHVEENGYPTGPGRSYADQETALRSMLGAANTYRANYNVSDYFWFDLRDADSSSPNFQQQYGLETSAYAPKPAFDAFRTLVVQLSIREPPPPAVVHLPNTRLRVLILRARCYRRGVFVDLRGDGVSRVRRVDFYARGRRAADSHAPFRRHIRLHRTRTAKRIRVLARIRLSAGRTSARRSVRCRIGR